MLLSSCLIELFCGLFIYLLVAAYIMKSFKTRISFSFCLLFLLGLGHWVIPSASAFDFSYEYQSKHLQLTQTSSNRARAIRQSFQNGFKTYKKYAWGNDEIGALTLHATNSRNGWGATIVDSLSSLLVMGLNEEFEEAVKFISKTDFTTSQAHVSVFETSIRYIGGLISAYELTNGTHPILLKKAISLADKLMHAWQNGSILPFGYLDFKTNSVILEEGKNITNLAEAGTLVLEYFKLSKYSGNPIYFKKADQAMRGIMKNTEIFPGLRAQFLDPHDARGVGDWVTWDGGADSYYEYLSKYSLMTANANPEYLDEWAQAVDSTIKYLIRTSASSISQSDHKSGANARERLYISSFSPQQNKRRYRMSHLACFSGGNFMLGGQLLNNLTIFNYGLKLTETCADSYSTSKSGIGPDLFGFVDKLTGDITADWNPSSQINLNEYNHRAIFPYQEGYYLRPEVIESMFYAYRYTGDPKWQELAWKAFESLKACCQISEEEGLFASLTQVDRIPTRDFEKARDLLPDGSRGWEDGPFRATPEYDDAIESFFWAETMKYFYLIFADPSILSLDDYVFSTEAHPLRIEKGQETFSRVNYGLVIN